MICETVLKPETFFFLVLYLANIKQKCLKGRMLRFCVNMYIIHIENIQCTYKGRVQLWTIKSKDGWILCPEAFGSINLLLKSYICFVNIFNNIVWGMLLGSECGWYVYNMNIYKLYINNTLLMIIVVFISNVIVYDFMLYINIWMLEEYKLSLLGV